MDLNWLGSRQKSTNSIRQEQMSIMPYANNIQPISKEWTFLPYGSKLKRQAQTIPSTL